MTTIGENDWLGTAPLFYHERTGAVSPDINAVIDLRSLEFDPDGLRDFLDLGYCAFGHTPVRHVRFLPPCTRLVRDDHGRLNELPQADPVDAWRDRVTDENEVLEQLRAAVRTWETSAQKPVVLPLSGGYDSRLLGALTANPAQVRAFSYGVSDNPARSTEVGYAEATARRLGIPWEHVRLGNYHRHLDRWDDVFGPCTHAHGMYHFEFFDQVRARVCEHAPLLSGIVGDAWAGSVTYRRAECVSDLPSLAYSHGLHARSLNARLTHHGAWREAFWDQRRERLRDKRFQVVEIIRLKMMLLRYLFRLPQALGFKPWSPFIDSSIALAMVCLPAERRQDRRWQQDFFAREKLLFLVRGTTRQNSLDTLTLRQFPPPPLNVLLLRELFDPSTIEEINRTLQHPSLIAALLSQAQTFPKVAGLARRLHVPNHLAAAYARYLTLRPIEQLLHRRNSA